MENLFFTILNMSITASVAIAVILLVRAVFRKKMPKWLLFLMWGIVFVRLILPISVPSDMSIYNLLPKTQTAVNGEGQTNYLSRMEFVYRPEIRTTPDNTLTKPEDGGEAGTKPVTAPSDATQVKAPLSLTWVLALVWICGMALFLSVALVFSLRVKARLRSALIIRDNPVIAQCLRAMGLHRRVRVYKSSMFDTPVVTGVFRPAIVLPAFFDMEKEEVLRHILLHELEHVRRFDMLTKKLSLLALCLHWFNPFVWAAFVLSGKDMESATDERVLSYVPEDIRRPYASSLLAMAVHQQQQRIPATASLVAFGESGVRTRVRDIMKYRKRTALAVAAALFILVGAGCTLLSNPQVSASTSPPAGNDDSSQSSVPSSEAPPPEVEKVDYSAYMNKYLLYLDAGGFMTTFDKPEDLGPYYFLQYALTREYNIFWGSKDIEGRYGEEFRRKDFPDAYMDGVSAYAFPGELIEARVLEHFDVPVEFLRDMSDYDPKSKTYTFSYGGGMGQEQEPIITNVVEDGDTLAIYYDVMTVPTEVTDGYGNTETIPASYVTSKILTVRLEGEGFTYESLKSQTTETLSDNALTYLLMQSMLTRYEAAVDGAAFEDGVTVDKELAYRFAVDWLLSNGAAKEYAVYERQGESQIWLCCDIPAERVYRIASTFFGVPEDSWQPFAFANYNATNDTFRVTESQPIETKDTFVVEKVERTDNGSILRLAISRKRNGETVGQREYRFAVFSVDKEMLSQDERQDAPWSSSELGIGFRFLSVRER